MVIVQGGVPVPVEIVCWVVVPPPAPGFSPTRTIDQHQSYFHCEDHKAINMPSARKNPFVTDEFKVVAEKTSDAYAAELIKTIGSGPEDKVAGV